jgi:hypothetical protein
MDTEVFGLKPDLIVVEFVNDFALPAHVLQHDYEVILDKAKEKNVRVILCAPHLPSPRVSRSATWESVAERPYVSILRELCKKNDFVALADVARRFQHLEKEGLRPELLYINGLNHPNDTGHAIYAEELVRCFVAPEKIAIHQK